jgi:hypothetical protein
MRDDALRTWVSHVHRRGVNNTVAYIFDPEFLCVPSSRSPVCVNSRTHVPQKLTGLISLYTNPVSILSVSVFE